MKTIKIFALTMILVSLIISCFPTIVHAEVAPTLFTPNSNFQLEKRTLFRVESEQVSSNLLFETPPPTGDHRIKIGYLLIIALPLIFFGLLIKKNDSKPKRH
jgi:hypothetical protein